MKRFILSLIFASLLVLNADAQKKIPHAVRTMNEMSSHRTEIIIPKVNGFNVYKADFHIHTTYSDGRVSPAGRVIEAWTDGLDIISITDHYEGHKGIRNFLKVTAPYNEDGKPTKYLVANAKNGLRVDFNAIHDEAVAQVKRSGYPMLLIKGCEMAREPKNYGHFNCLFLQDLNTVYDPDINKAIKNVHDQGGIVIHNHPSYRRGTTDKSEWHEKAYSEKMFDGIEVANGYTFYPHMVRRCIDEKLTMFGNTDEHGTTAYRFTTNNCFRTMTLVLAKNLTEKAVKDAILKRRTLVYSGGCVIGEEKLLSDLFNASVDCRLIKEDSKKGSRTYALTNMSSIPYKLRRGKTNHILEPFKTMTISFGKNKKTGEFNPVKVRVENMWHIDYKHPVIKIEIDK